MVSPGLNGRTALNLSLEEGGLYLSVTTATPPLRVSIRSSRAENFVFALPIKHFFNVVIFVDTESVLFVPGN
jgi:hypothetical protein